NLKGGGSLNPASHETVDKKMHYIYQDGQAVYKFAVRKMAEASAKVLERNGVTGADLGCFIPHQANKRIITATSDRLGMDPERVIINIEKYGNTSAVSLASGMVPAEVLPYFSMLIITRSGSMPSRSEVAVIMRLLAWCGIKQLRSAPVMPLRSSNLVVDSAILRT